MDQALTAGLITGPLGALVVLLVQWLLGRRKNNAEVGLTIDQRWERWANELTERLAKADDRLKAADERQTRTDERLEKAEGDVETLKGRVTELERSLSLAEQQVASLRALLRSVTRWALTLKDELLKAGGTVPLMPADVETALTTLDDRP